MAEVEELETKVEVLLQLVGEKEEEVEELRSRFGVTEEEEEG